MQQSLFERRDALIVELYRRQGTWQEIARSAVISYSWLCKFAQRKIPNPGIESLAQLERALAVGAVPPIPPVDSKAAPADQAAA